MSVVTDTLLVELGTEELPPSAVPVLGSEFAAQLSQQLHQQGFVHKDCRTFYTPRRLAVQLSQLSNRQPDQTVRRVGPAVGNAYDEQGQPTAAALGFAKSCGVDIAQLSLVKEKGAERLLYVTTQPGNSLAQQLESLLEQVVQALPMKQRMRWGEHQSGFIRPVRWLCVLYGDEVLACSLFGMKADRCTYAHRAHGGKALSLKHADDYETALAAGKVIADFKQRCDVIERQVQDVVGDALVDMDEQSLHIMAAMTEWPQVIRARFDESFLRLPEAVLIQVLKSGLKVLPVLDKERQLLPQFLIISNVQSDNPALIQKGYEWVAQTRLSDAMFFVEQDKKTVFAERQTLLKDIVFQEQLGTLADKSERLQRLVGFTAAACGADETQAVTAAQLCKCDLTTDMVNEYPELEGSIGQYYVSDDGITDAAVATAIGEHYRPRYAGDALPESPAGIALALADKMDVLTGIFSIGRAPTGTKDPFGLRRCALGIVRMSVEKEIPLDLETFIDIGLQLYAHTHERDVCRQQVLVFICERLRTYCLDQGFAFDCVDAVMAVGTGNPLDVIRRLSAVKQFIRMPEAESLTAANKRIVNLVSKQGMPAEAVATGALIEAAEKDLFAQVRDCETVLMPLLAQMRYLEGIQTLVRLHQPINQFFDEVLVMAEDRVQRKNRLALIGYISRLFMRIADFSKLQGHKEQTTS